VQLQYVSLVFSLAAVAVAFYGIYERRLAAARAERIRLTVITDDLEKLKLDLIAEAEAGRRVGVRIEALNARVELLAQQGLSLIREHELPANSTECRTIAFALYAVGFTDDADEVWRLAIDKGETEGDVQRLLAARGYSYYLFRQGRSGEAHQKLSLAISQFSVTDDQSRLWLADTLNSWAYWEARIPDVSPDTLKGLADHIRTLHSECQSTTVKAQIEDLFFDPPGDPGAARLSTADPSSPAPTLRPD
jgi:hypothetical protein